MLTSLKRLRIAALGAGMCSLLQADHHVASDFDRVLVAPPTTLEGLPGEGPFRIHNENFLKRWVQRRSSWINRAEEDQGAVVFFGDSITQGWPNLSNYFPGMKSANRGIGSDTTRGMLIRLQEDVIDLNPSAVVILAGTNDLADKASAEMIAGNIKRILDALEAHNSELPIVLCQLLPSSPEKNRAPEDIKEINERIAAVAKGGPRITVLDTYTLFANEDGNARIEEFPDLLHLNNNGYGKWAAALRPILATLGLLETDTEDFQQEEGYVSLFNGRTLNGWGFRITPPPNPNRKPNPNAPPRTVITEPENFYGQRASSDGRYAAINGRLVVTTPTEGRRIQQLWTTREFANDFILKLEFRATPNADSGVFLRGRQLQCRDYPLAGPYTELTRYKPQDWNELVITVKGNTSRCECNGELLEAAFEIPDNGPIGLEGDRGQMEYRRIRIKEF